MTEAVYIGRVILIALVAGALGLVVSLALRRNTKRARSWEKTQGIADQQFVFALLPGVSLVLLGMGGLGLVLPGLGTALNPVLGPTLAVIAGTVALAGVVLSFYGLFVKNLPQWLLPTWAQKPTRRRR